VIDLEHKVVKAGGKEYPFTIDEGIRHNLIHGLDDISITLQEEADITAYEQSRERKGPVTTGL
jgi:3-isopropylmalate/(R)-2-methylmalate dehydratase small subunit